MSDLGKKWLVLIAKLAVTTGVLWFIASGLDLTETAASLAKIKPLTVVICLAIFVSHFFAVAIRWQYFVAALHDGSVTLLRATRLVAIGSFFNQVFLGTIAGDAIRIIYLRRRDAGLTASVGSVLLDRYLALFTMWIALVLALPVFFNVFSGHPTMQSGAVSICVLGAASLSLPAARLFVFVEKIQVLHFLHRPYRFVVALSDALNTTFSSVTAFLHVYLPSAYVIVSSSLAVWLIAHDLGFPLNFDVSIIVTTAAILVSAIPVTIAGWGLRELSFVALLGALSVGPEESLAVSVLFGLHILCASLLGGLVWLSIGTEH